MDRDINWRKLGRVVLAFLFVIVGFGVQADGAGLVSFAVSILANVIAYCLLWDYWHR